MKLTINGKKRSYAGHPFKRLLDVLRDDFALTGTKEGCGEGECGACTVLIDGEPVNSCLVPVGQMEGAKVETVESLASAKKLSRMQSSFLKKGGAQCGICTPGMLMAAEAHCRAGGSKSRKAICTAVSGNLCRCTGYKHIIDSIAATMKGRK